MNPALKSNPLVSFIGDIITFIDVVLVPLVFAVAFIVFLWGVFNFFIAGGADEEKREKGKQFMVWGLIGFFVMVSIWGIVNLMVNTFGFGGQQRPGIPTFNGSSNTNTTNTTNTNGNGGVIFPNGRDGTENDFTPDANGTNPVPSGNTGTEADWF